LAIFSFPIGLWPSLPPALPKPWCWLKVLKPKNQSESEIRQIDQRKVDSTFYRSKILSSEFRPPVMTLHWKSAIKQYCIKVIMLSKVIWITLSKEEFLTKCHYLWILKWSLCQNNFINLLWRIYFLSKLSHTVTLSKNAMISKI
jgi:hypothetical protein